MTDELDEILTSSDKRNRIPQNDIRLMKLLCPPIQDGQFLIMIAMENYLLSSFRIDISYGSH